jgi:hypothetical protein
MQIIDSDGHINDHACGDEIAEYMPKGNQMAKLFPEFDHLHFRYLKQNRRATGNPSAQDWSLARNRSYQPVRQDQHPGTNPRHGATPASNHQEPSSCESGRR